MNKKTFLKIGIFLLIVALFAAAFPYLQEYLSLEQIKSKRQAFTGYYEANRLLVLSGYFVLYVFVTALSLPGAAIMTLLAGALFKFPAGLILVSFASSIGATGAFLVARYLVGESLQKKYGDKLQGFNEGIKREGAFYLFALRLIPVVPFFLINVLMALTPIKTLTFYWVSQAGMLAGTAVYVYAGTELGKIDSLQGILSPQLIAAFVAIAVLPFVAKKFVAILRKKREAQTNPGGTNGKI